MKLFFQTLILFFGIAAPLFADDTLSLGSEAPTDSAPAEEKKPRLSSSDLCPAQNELSDQCEKESYTAENLFSGDSKIDPWKKGFSKLSRCELWWWAHHVQTWQYAPLSEWADHVNDALLENLDRGTINDILGNPPPPPTTRLNTRDLPVSTCHRLATEAELKMNEKLHRLNLLDIPQGFLDELIAACLVFEVETAPWKRIVTSIVGAYLMPVGNTNFVIVARPRFTLFSNPEVMAAEESTANSMAYSAVGHCPVSMEPRTCVEQFFKEGRLTNTNFMGPAKIQMRAVPFRADVDTLYRGGRITHSLPLELDMGDNGGVIFYFKREDGERAAIKLGLRDGNLSLETDQYLCDPNFDKGRRLYLRPLALGEKLDDLYEKLSIYSPNDFPETSRTEKTGREVGCKGGKTYSQWAAETANAAKHYSHHGTTFDSLYRSVAQQRFRWTAESKGTAKTKDGLTFGVWRKGQLDTPIYSRGPMEQQAKKFALESADGSQKDSSIAFRMINIDGVSATEVWYYAKDLPLVPDNPASKGHILIQHLGDFNEIYERSVIGKLTSIEETCAPMDEQKTGFLGAMYSLFNAAPLEQGDEIVGRVFMAAAYTKIFGTKLSRMSKCKNIDIDAMTMSFEHFLAKYVPIID